MSGNHKQLSRLNEDLGKISDQQLAKQSVVKAVNNAASEIESIAKAYAPVATGELRHSITAFHGDGHATVIALAPHAVFIEFGTWQHNQFAPKTGTYTIQPKRAESLAFPTRGGVVHAQKVSHPGIPAQPYMGPAYDRVVPGLEAHLASLGADLIAKGPKEMA
jgi:hypothetical protein